MADQLSTRQQLIGELMNRPGFIGALVYFDKEMLHGTPGKGDDLSLAISPRLSPENARLMLTHGIGMLTNPSAFETTGESPDD